jgi:transcriptional repressor NrdR
VERRLPWIVKKDGRREPFVREKVLHGIALACRKRPIDAAIMEDAVRRVETQLETMRDAEVPSSVVGEAVMQVLRDIDEVAYVRFASVYREFGGVEQFIETIRPLRERAS